MPSLCPCRGAKTQMDKVLGNLSDLKADPALSRALDYRPPKVRSSLCDPMILNILDNNLAPQVSLLAQRVSLEKAQREIQ